jgi:hypothetical protein
MRTLFVLTCALALASTAVAAQEDTTQAPKRRQATSAQAARPAPAAVSRPVVRSAPRYQQTREANPFIHQRTYRGGQTFTAERNLPGTRTNTGARFQSRHFDLGTKPSASVAGVTYHAGNRIQGSQTWQGASYTPFRNYTSQWHDRDWWRSHHSRIVFVFGSPYFWDAGYWYPAWGYYPNAYYAYDGPIYGYNDLPPDQVVANVQAALQAEGYYHGAVDGLLGPLTRAAIADYQRDHGLYITSAIDEPTLSSLGMT